jgi:hypothetical protein
MAAEVFNCELSKLTDLFFTSREELCTTAKQAPSSPKKEIQSSPLPREEEDNDNEEQEDNEDEEEEEDED